MKLDNLCVHGVPQGRACEACEAATGAAKDSDGRQLGNAAFWEHPMTIEAQLCLDVWGSYLYSRMSAAECPTFDAIFERPVPFLKAWIDEQSGLKVVDWPMFRLDQTARVDAAERLIALGVHVALHSTGMLEVIQPALMRLYPRTGPYSGTSCPDALQLAAGHGDGFYSVGVPASATRAGRSIGRAVRQLERAAIEAVREARMRSGQPEAKAR